MKRGALRAVVEPERLAPAPRAQPADAVAPMDADDDAKAEAKSIDAAATPATTPPATPARGGDGGGEPRRRAHAGVAGGCTTRGAGGFRTRAQRQGAASRASR